MAENNATAAAPVEEPITTVEQWGAKWEGFAWKDCTTEYNSTVDSMEAWEHRIINGVSVEDIMSAPEIMDVKTDLHHNWKQNKPLEILEKTKGALPDLAKLNDTEVLDLMDAHFTLEQQVFVDNNDPVSSILLSVFAHKASLAEGNAVLKAYLDAYYYDVLASLARVGTSQVADEDEFPLLEQAVDTLTKRSAENRPKIEDLKKALVDAKGKTKNADIIARLEHRLVSLDFSVTISATDYPEEATLASEGVNKKAREQCAAVVEKIKALNRNKSDEAVPAHKQIFLEDCFSWLRISIPNKGVKLCSFTRAKDIALQIHQQYDTVLGLFPMKELARAILDFEAINTARYHLASRALLSVIVSRQVTSNDWKELILASFEAYGITFLRKVLANEDGIVRECLNYRTGQGMPAAKTAEEERTFIDQVDNIVVRLAISVHDFLRVLAQHRALTNRNIAAMFQRTWDIMNEAISYDALFGVRPARQPPQQQQHDTKAQRVFFHWASVLYNFAYSTYVNTSVDLDLVTRAEFFGVIFLKIQASRDQQDCTASLTYVKGQTIPKKHNKMGNIPAVSPTVYTRKQVDLTGTPLEKLDLRSQLEHAVCQQLFILCAALEKYGVLEFKTPKASLVSAEDIFNHRFGAVLGNNARIPFFGLELTNQNKNNMLAEMLKSDMTQGKVTKLLEQLAKNMGGAVNVLKQSHPELDQPATAVGDAQLADLKSALTQMKIGIELLKQNWSDSASAEENAANIKDKFSVDVGYSKFGLPMLLVKTAAK